MGRLHRRVQLRPGRPRIPVVKVVHQGEDVGRRGRNRRRPGDAERRRLQGDDDGQAEDDDHEGDQDLLEHGTLPCEHKWTACSGGTRTIPRTAAAAQLPELPGDVERIPGQHVLLERIPRPRIHPAGHDGVVVIVVRDD